MVVSERTEKGEHAAQRLAEQVNRPAGLCDRADVRLNNRRDVVLREGEECRRGQEAGSVTSQQS